MALTTLSMAKTYLKIPALETSQDTLVQFFIDTASEMLASETDRKLEAQTVVDKFHGRSSNIIVLTEWPVNSIAELRFDQSSQFTSPQTLIDPDEYSLGDDGTTIVLHKRTVPKGYNNVRITYNAGYTPIPKDLENACLWMVFYYYKMRQAEDIGRQSRSKGDESLSMVQEAPTDVKNVIRRYKRTECAAAHAPVWNT